MTQHNILINGQWRQADAEREFSPMNPNTGEPLTDVYPVSTWSDVDQALTAAREAFAELQNISRGTIAKFLNDYASAIEENASSLVEMAHLETGLPTNPRLADVEIPRTVGQLRQAANAAADASWTQPTIDSANNIRSMLQGIGPVAVFGPNNFPYAFGSASGGDFAAAICAGNPVIAKSNSSHPGTTRLFAELAHKAAQNNGLPAATVQLIYATSRDSGYKLVSDHRLGATGFTGSRTAGLALKEAADIAGIPIYLELSSVNPVVVLQGALDERSEAIATEFTGSCTMAAGQLCTKPGLVVVPQGQAGDEFVASVAEKFAAAPVGTLLNMHAAAQIKDTATQLIEAGAHLHTSSEQPNEARFCQTNTLMSVTGDKFIQNPELFQTEMFGNASLIIRSASTAQTVNIVNSLEGNLTGCIYSDTNGSDDSDYDAIAPALAVKVGRMINDKMPTGVAVSPAMNHGGPFPSSGHPGFTAVGLPAAAKRFGALKCFDGVRENRLPDVLQNTNPSDNIWRLIDGKWTTANL